MHPVRTTPGYSLISDERYNTYRQLESENERLRAALAIIAATPPSAEPAIGWQCLRCVSIREMAGDALA